MVDRDTYAAPRHGYTRRTPAASSMVCLTRAAVRENPPMPDDTPIYALNLFNVADREEYLAYSRRSAAEVARHGGRVVALGRFSDAVKGEIAPREALILVEWKSRAHFDAYCADPALDDLHPHREAGAGDYVWHLFDRLEDLRPLLRD